MSSKVSNKQPKPWEYMVAMLILVVIATCLLTSSCSTVKYVEVEKEKIVYRDSIAYRDSILNVPIPLESNQAIVTVNDTSKLETSVAVSTAFVDNSGHLNHKLENKRVTVVYSIKVPEHFHYTGVTNTKTETITKIEYRDKPLSWWQSFRLKAFWWLLGGFVLALLWIFRKFIKIWYTTTSQTAARR